MVRTGGETTLAGRGVWSLPIINPRGQRASLISAAGILMMDLQTATHLDVEAEVRYWEDAYVMGTQEDNDAPTIYGADGDMWRIRINLMTGQIIGWPSGIDADIHYKVCDQGEYWLSNNEATRIAKWKGCYVPSEFLCFGDNGYGDYIIFKVDEAGVIQNYVRPEIDPEEWKPA